MKQRKEDIKKRERKGRDEALRGSVKGKWNCPGGRIV
jgi:hypothetical protein